MEKYPINNYLKNSNTLSFWLYKIHNYVNKKLQLPTDFTVKDRLIYYPIFLYSLSHILPFDTSKNIFINFLNNNDILKKNRSDYIELIYSIEKKFTNYIECKCMSFKEKCEFIEQYRAKCKKKTCRKGKEKDKMGK